MPPGPRPRHSRADIAAAALAMADRAGDTGAVSIRALAAELGASPMTLYRYFASREELVAAMIDAAAGEVALPAPGPAEVRLVALGLAIYDRLVAHPALLRERLTRPFTSAHTVDVAEALIALLREAGVGAEDAARGSRAIVAHVFGFAVLAVPVLLGSGREDAARGLAGVDAATHPHVAAAAPTLRDSLADRDQLAWELRALVRGLRDGAHDAAVDA